MAVLPEDNSYPAGIYQLEQDDPVLGGAPNEATKAGIDNIPHQQLARRTNWLKARVDGLLESVVAASATVAGLVRLSSATNSTSQTLAATPAAVKLAMDNANNRVPQSRTISTGAGMTGGGALTNNLALAVSFSAQPAAGDATAASLRLICHNIGKGEPERLTTAALLSILDVPAIIAATQAGAVGSWALAKNLTGSTVNTGSLAAGTSLRAASVGGVLGVYLTGTWRAMSVTPADDVGMFLRVL
ncbi:MAG: phage tail protein [Paracoccus sp. (in: a-proteobacteria)]|uniref:phage tail protein n=1 Tax=Paracoccus sp. TaxID=267 RepID=UPI0026E05300|nr:phage tail protein [Paracoccus sp. (in: a-proteobacteria)]MDO5631141.1 phage tail protein [Paracoccus sp. (in: a-proteobacteria)]